MATRVGEAKKKVLNVDHNLADGLTGMGSRTRKHFIEVRGKILDFIGQQDEYEHDYQLDGRKPPLFSTPVVLHKQVPQSRTSSSQSNRQHKRPSSRPVGAK